VVTVTVFVEIVVAKVTLDVFAGVYFRELVLVSVHGGVLRTFKFFLVFIQSISVLRLKFALMTFPFIKLHFFNIFFG